MNVVKEILQIKKQIKQLYCYLTGTGGAFTESDPTVPQYVKNITELEIAYWNEKREDRNLYITEDTTFSSIGETQLIFNRNIAYALDNLNVDTSDKADLNAGNVDTPNAILWRDALDIYTKAEVDGKFYQGGEESLTEITDISLTANVLYISYLGENGTTQTKSVDLSGLATIDIHIEDATYNAATNIITITDNDGNAYNIDLSEFSIITETDINGVTTLTQEAVIKLVISKVGQTGQYADLLGKPTIPAPVDISNKLDKPTTDGEWVVTRTAGVSGYADASTLGKNIANSNLVWTVDRIQKLNRKKLSFTGGRVSVTALELETTSESTVPNKIWTGGTDLWHTDSSGINRKLANDNQVIKIISGDVTLDDSFHNCIVRIVVTCNITVPNTLRADFSCVFDVIGNYSGTFIAGGLTIFSAPSGVILLPNSMCTLYKYDSFSYRLNGGLI